MDVALALLLALALDALIGWPEALLRRIGHPVIWIGSAITALERRFNHATGDVKDIRRAGMFSAASVVGLTALIAWGLQSVLPDTFFGTLLLGLLAWPWIAARSLYTHVGAVADPLIENDINGARQAVSMIVGRNPETLDAAGIARASIESLAENTSDGVTAPLFWGILLGLPGLAGYKAINTLDSMIGYRNDRYRDFGRFSARLDDLVNLIPARLSGLIYCAVAQRPADAWRVMIRDAARHRSPNAGWPEAAMAGALDIRLSGPRVYDGKATGDPWLNAGAQDPGGRDIRRALGLFKRAVAVLAVLVFFVWLV